jgi:hydrogenase/urease accessory protein HupE
MLTMIKLLLALTALYCAGMWLLYAFAMLRGYRAGAEIDTELVENDTFHLGLCFILAIGALGILLK